jgi:hypothetical protein
MKNVQEYFEVKHKAANDRREFYGIAIFFALFIVVLIIH